MSENTSHNRRKVNYLDRRFIRTLRFLICLQKNNNLTTDLLTLGTLIIEETNPTPGPLPSSKPATPQLLATTPPAPTMNPRFANACTCATSQTFPLGFLCRFRRVLTLPAIPVIRPVL
jgi:hypothetical protein